ncbi:hypothetical protein GQR58_001022 [Nymphon striatum]|nr:hypothetical protein GQR58_001022 [Nymphon striatum]
MWTERILMVYVARGYIGKMQQQKKSDLFSSISPAVSANYQSNFGKIVNSLLEDNLQRNFKEYAAHYGVECCNSNLLNCQVSVLKFLRDYTTMFSGIRYVWRGECVHCSAGLHYTRKKRIDPNKWVSLVSVILFWSFPMVLRNIGWTLPVFSNSPETVIALKKQNLVEFSKEMEI